MSVQPADREYVEYKAEIDKLLSKAPTLVDRIKNGSVDLEEWMDSVINVYQHSNEDEIEFALKVESHFAVKDVAPAVAYHILSTALKEATFDKEITSKTLESMRIEYFAIYGDVING